DQGVLGGRASVQEGFARAASSGAAFAGGQVEFDVHVSGRGRERLGGCRGEGSAAEVGMHHDAGRVQDRREGECTVTAQGGLYGGFDGLSGEIAMAGEVLVGVDDLAYGRGADPAGGCLGRGQGQQVVGARDVPAGIVVHLHLLARVGGRARAGRLIWRRRTGIEPARPRYSVSPVLKTGEPTRNSDASTASVAAGAEPCGGAGARHSGQVEAEPRSGLRVLASALRVGAWRRSG